MKHNVPVQSLMDHIKTAIDVDPWAKEMAAVLLARAIPVEPIPFFTETGAESPNYVICGHCKSIKAIMSKQIKQKYCHECGRPVKLE